MSILPPPCRQQRTRHTVPPGRRRNLAVPQKALLHHPELVSIAPVSPARGIRGRQHFYLGSELTVGHKVGRITDLEIPSDGLRRRDTIGVTQFTYYRWRKEFGGLKTNQVKRLKELEKENERLRKAVSDLTLEKLILKEAASGNF